MDWMINVPCDFKKYHFIKCKYLMKSVFIGISDGFHKL
ncbi:hypothetical protein FLJC2902T_12930 [Flavobacterium limnosediminis JC2902]|uniref:Uncharacterized protein n=1 Tax=Flavobacterium limnosediminis JC2902 TaxID=1341181 RepID=V6SR99_9FLAO|nr:hypothetical protein FLJC2902T_12930 [Flavobacterium limnosediminis JC2902]